MIKKKIISFVLVFVMFLSLSPNMNYTTAYGTEEDTSISEMDALSALGIDSSAAPEGFDENDQLNPYGKDTMTMNPVEELYVVGLSESTSLLATPISGNVSSKSENIDNSFKGTLYGHDDTVSKNITDIINSSGKISLDIASGKTTVNGNYIYLADDNKNSYLQSDGYSVANSLTSTSTGNFTIGASKVVNGNFDGNEEGKSAQTALLYTGNLDENGGLYLRIGDVLNGSYGDSIELVPPSMSIGNSSIEITVDGETTNTEENFSTDPYLMQNYMQVTAGDYDGDGIDEIAAFIPEYGSSRIAIYKFKEKSDQPDSAYKVASQWEEEWTYSLREEGYVSNMVSLVSGDFNEDGVTDLGATWGYYFGPSLNNGSKAVVMFGSKDEMLENSQEFALTYSDPAYEESNSEKPKIVRASFTFGDITGGGESLILGGQSASNIEDGIDSRYIALYNWNGSSFTSNTSKNFELFAYEENDDGERVYENPAMAVDVDGNGRGIFYSSSLCPSNLAVVSQGLSESAYLYLDSLKITYGDNGLEIAAPLDQNGANDGNNEEYVEYGAVSGDLIGLGYDSLITMQQTKSSIEPVISSNTVWKYYYKNSFYRWIGRKTWYKETTTDLGCSQFTPNETTMIARDFKNKSSKKEKVDSSTSLCLPNTDNDTSYMKYTGSHYFTYTDPEVLAVLASPPYFGDLLNRNDLSGSYAESTTSYSSTKGSGGGDTFNSTIEAGVYVSVEQEFSVFGVTVASAEAEASITAGFTYETESTSNLEQTISYSATSGEDMVAFFSIPLEIYEYDAYTLDENGEYVNQTMTVSIPHIASVQLLSLDAYESIASDYDILPQISGTVLTHTLGDLSTYDSSENGYLNALAYSGDWSKVGYSSNDGGASITQEISMSSEESTSYEVSSKLETKVGAGAGGVTVGVTVGAEVGFGSVTTSTSGNSFSGELQNMPIEAQEYGYGYCWKIFSYLYNDGTMSFPIVDYLITDVTAPSPIPTDFEQSAEKTTDTEIAFTWTYDKMVAGFQIYRYYEFPDGPGNYELKFIPMTAGTYDIDDGVYHFEFIDENLSPYTDYQYQIQTVRSSVPNNSIPSEIVSARTKTITGYPQFSLDGLGEDGYLKIYPDSTSTITAEITNAELYNNNISYQWQKFTDGIWADMDGKTTNELTFSASGTSDESSYRCRSNVIYYDEDQGNNYYISSYSDTFETKYSKRTAVKSAFSATTFTENSENGVIVELELVSGNSNHYTAPTGYVTYSISGTDYDVEYTVDLESSGDKNEDEKNISVATLQIADLPDGVYEVGAYYGGNRVFTSYSTSENETFLIGDEGYQLLLLKGDDQSVEYTYGDVITPVVQYLSKDADTNATIIETVSANIHFEIDGINISTGENFDTPDVGNYTLTAKTDSGKFLAYRDFSVSQKEITITAKTPKDENGDTVKVGKGEVLAKYPILEITSGSMVFSENLDDLELVIYAANSAGTSTTLDNNTDAGNYTIIGKTSSNTDEVIYNNYTVTYVSETYTIIGRTYEVTLSADKYKNIIAGTITLVNSEDGLGGKFSSGTDLLFYATPYSGYEVDTWSAIGSEVELLDDSQNGKSKLSLKLNAEATAVTVSFKKSQNTLSTFIVGDGSIDCDSNTAFISGGIVNSGADITYTARPNEGYHFKEWTVQQNNSDSQVKYGTNNEDLSNTITYEMGDADTTLIAVFARDTYTLTLSDNLEAVYSYATDDLENPTAEKTVYNGAKITGDTEVLVKTKDGYKAAEDADWMVNENIVTSEVDTSGYTFNIIEDTNVSVDTIQLGFTITKIEENGIISITKDGSTLSELENIEGGSKLIFTAQADHGYAFDSFVVTGSEKYIVSNNTLTIETLGSDITIKAIYTQSTDYTLSAEYNERGNLKYTLYDTFGNIVETGNLYSDNSVNINDGDSIELVAVPDSGFMVDKWTINGEINDTSSKTYNFDNISDNIDISLDFISQTSYTVNYTVDSTNGNHGKLNTATSDEFAFESGDPDIGGNSKIIVESLPDTGYMVDHWTINGNAVLNEDDTYFIEKTLIIESLTSMTTIVDIVVYFSPQTDYTVTFNKINTDIDFEYTPNDASTDGNIRHGAQAIFDISPEDGYRIYDVSISGIDKDDYNIVKNEDSKIDDYGTWTLTASGVDNNIIISATAKEIHSISIDTMNGGNLSTITTTDYPQKAIEGETVVVKKDESLDYTFNSWNIRDENNIKIDVTGNENEGYSFVMPDENITVSADFSTIDTVDISYKVYEKSDSDKIGYNGSLSATIYRDADNYPNDIFDSSTSGAITAINRAYNDEYVNWPKSTVILTAAPEEGYKVYKWTVDSIEYYSPLNLPLPSDTMNTLSLDINEGTEDIDVILQFEPIGDSITYSVDGGNGSISSAKNETTGNEFVSGNTVSSETYITLEAQAEDGYEVEAWMVDNSIVQAGSDNTYTYGADGINGASITVKFARIPYTVGYSSEHGSISCTQVENKGQIRGDTSITFTVEASPGYKFDSYTVNGIKTSATDTDDSLTMIVSEDTIVTANFVTSENCSVIYEVIGGNGSLSAIKNDIEFTSGNLGAATEIVSFTATADKNYMVKSWTIDGNTVEKTDKTVDLTISESIHHVSVEFERSSYIVNFSMIGDNANIETNPDITSGDSLAKENTVEFTAYPSQGYQVDIWKLNDVEITNSKEKTTYTIEKLSEDTSILVVFEKIPSYDITIETSGIGEGTVTAFVNNVEATITEGKITVKNHDKVKLIASPKDEYNTGKWSISNASDYDISNITLSLNDVTSDVSVEASFNVAELITVKAAAVKSSNTNTNINGSVSVKAGYDNNLTTINAIDSTVNISKGKTIQFTAQPEDGYMVKDWSVNGVVIDSISNTLTVVPETNINVEVSFETILAYSIPESGTNYTITVDSITPDELTGAYAGKIRERGNATITITPDTEYYFDILDVFDVDCLTEDGSEDGNTENIISVTDNNDGSYTIKVENLKSNITGDISVAKPVISIAVVEHGTITSTYSYIDNEDNTQTVQVNDGDIIDAGTILTVYAKADKGYKLGSWDDDMPVSSSSYTISLKVAKDDLTLSALFKKKVSVVSGGGTAIVVAKSDPVMQAVEDGIKNKKGKTVATVATEEQNSDGEYEQNIPSEFFDEEDTILEVVTPKGKISMPSNMFNESPDKDIQISLNKVDSSDLDLPEEFKDKPVIDINIKVDGLKTKWSSDDKEITVSIPYTLTEEEANNPHKIIAVYIDDDGNITPLTNSYYDTETGMIIFKTKHTSYYSVQYVNKSFEDIDTYAWAQESIEALATRGIINGVSENEFAPQNDITRADFVLLITRFFEFEGSDETNFSDVKSDKYYSKAIAAAKELGLVSGTGDNMFNPLETISRQDMMVIIERALGIAEIKDEIKNESGNTLDSYTDIESISNYAVESINYLIEKGIVSGDGTNINPTSNTTRAEVAVLIYRLLDQF